MRTRIRRLLNYKRYIDFLVERELEARDRQTNGKGEVVPKESPAERWVKDEYRKGRTLAEDQRRALAAELRTDESRRAFVYRIAELLRVRVLPVRRPTQCQ